MEYTCTITLDPKADPRTIDLVIKEGDGDSVGKTSKGVYKVEGDTLTLCVTRPGGETRPAELKAAEARRTCSS